MRRLVLAVVMLGLACAPAAAGTPTDELRATITEVNRILADPATEGRLSERVSAILDIVDQRFAFREAAEIALGQPWGRLTPDAQAEFIGLFADLFERAFVMTIGSKVRPADGLDVRYRSESISGSDATVLTTVAGRGNELPVDYRMVRRGESWLISDVVLDGVSFVDNYRAQFERVMRLGSWEELIARMQARRLDAPEWWPDPRMPRVRQMMASARESSDASVVAVAGGGPRVAAAPVEPPSPPEPVRAVEPTLTPVPAVTPVPAPTPAPTPVSTDSRPSPPDPPLVVASTAPVPTSAPRPERITYWVQAGAFRDVERASQLESALLALGLSVAMRPTEVSSGSVRVPLMRVQVGPFPNQSAALAAHADLRKRGYPTFVVVDRE